MKSTPLSWLAIFFDTGSPPSYARELYNRFVVQLQQTGCRLGGAGGQPRLGGDAQ